jgi:hypothetical protein
MEAGFHFFAIVQPAILAFIEEQVTGDHSQDRRGKIDKDIGDPVVVRDIQEKQVEAPMIDENQMNDQKPDLIDVLQILFHYVGFRAWNSTGDWDLEVRGMDLGMPVIYSPEKYRYR